jgi:hypothetical protein
MDEYDTWLQKTAFEKSLIKTGDLANCIKCIDIKINFTPKLVIKKIVPS